MFLQIFASRKKKKTTLFNRYAFATKLYFSQDRKYVSVCISYEIQYSLRASKTLNEKGERAGCMLVKPYVAYYCKLKLVLSS
jgi:hypothetical protein